MNISPRNIFAVLSLVCLTTSAIRAETLYLSNLAESSPNGFSYASDRWLSQSFQTGTEEAYNLDTITISSGGQFGGTIEGFSMQIFTDNAGVPGTSLGNLAGAPPLTFQPYTYTADNMTLAGSTKYWIVLSTTNPLASGSLFWRSTDSTSFNAAGNWVVPMAQAKMSLDGGGSWQTLNAVGGAFQFSATATVPEPSACILAGMGMLVLGRCWWRRALR